MIKILIIDDHAIVREGLKQILVETPDLEVASEANNGQEALERLRAGHLDLVVLDISLPGTNGLVVLQQIKNQFPEVPVLILSIHAEEQYAMRALKAGAAGYLTKETAPQELVTAIQKVVGGGKYVSPSLMERMVSDLGKDLKKALHETLSDREFQVLCMIATGKGLTEIAEDLNLSVKTVSTHRTRMLKKMRLKNNAEMIHYAIRHGLVK